MERKIRNFEALAAASPLRRIALEIAEAGLGAIDTERAIDQAVRLDGAMLKISGEDINLDDIDRIIVIAIGKCGLAAGAQLEEIIGKRLSGGVVLDVREGKLSKLKTFCGTHPFPSQKNIDATREIISALKDLKKDDLVIFVVSGGGSTLLCQPQNITFKDEELLLKCLFDSGANIQEINILRKRLSRARGGHLAAYAYPGRVVSLIFSDVPGVQPEFVASGPTMRDTTTIQDAQKVFEKYDLEKRCGVSTAALIEAPRDEKYFANVRNVVIVSNQIALEVMRSAAAKFGFRVEINPIGLNGEARERADAIAAALSSAGPKSAVLWGGESTVALESQSLPAGAGREGSRADASLPSRGGRNLELALAALELIKGDQIILSLASDGKDNTDFAGGIADTITRDHVIQLKLDPREFLRTHSSYAFFAKTGDYLLTGDTGSNVADLVIALYP